MYEQCFNTPGFSCRRFARSENQTIQDTQQHSWYVNAFEPEGDPWNVVWYGVSLVFKGELMISSTEPAELQLTW